MNQTRQKLNTVVNRSGSVNNRSVGLGYSQKYQPQFTNQNYLEQQAKKKKQSSSILGTNNAYNAVNTSHDGNKKPKYINVKNSIDTTSFNINSNGNIINDISQNQENSNLSTKNLPTSFKAYLTQNSQNIQIADQYPTSTTSSKQHGLPQKPNNTINTHQFFNQSSQLISNNFQSSNQHDNSIVVHTNNDSPSPVKIMPSKIFNRQSLNLGNNSNATLRQSIETRISYNKQNQSFDRSSFHLTPSNGNGNQGSNNNSFNQVKQQQQLLQQNIHLINKDASNRNTNQQNSQNNMQSTIQNNTSINLMSLTLPRNSSGSSKDGENKSNQNIKVVEDIIDTILFQQTESQQIQNLIEQNKNLLATQQALGAEIQNLSNKVQQYEKEIEKLKETIIQEREESKQQLKEKINEMRNFQQLIQMQTNSYQMEDELKQLIVNIFEVAFISKSYETKEQQQPLFETQNIFFNLLQAKLKDLMQKINPFVVNMNMQNLLTEHGNQIRTELDLHIMKMKTSNILRNSDQLISPKGVLKALSSIHQKKNSSLDTTNNSNSFNFGKAHSRHISANSNSNDYGAKNYLSMESASGLEKENNQNLCNLLPIGQQTFSQQDFEQNNNSNIANTNGQFLQYLSPPQFQEEDQNKFKNNQSSFSFQIQAKPTHIEQQVTNQQQNQQFQNFETLSAIQPQNQGGFYQQQLSGDNFNNFSLVQQNNQQPTQNYYDNLNKQNMHGGNFIQMNNQIISNNQPLNQNLQEIIQIHQQNQQKLQLNSSNPHQKCQSQQFFQIQEMKENDKNTNIFKQEAKINNNRHHSNPPTLNSFNYNQNINKKQSINIQQYQQEYSKNENIDSNQKVDKEIEISKLSPCFNSSQENSKRSLYQSNAHNSLKKINKQIHGKERMSQILFQNDDKHPNISYDAMRRVKTEADDQANLDEDYEFNYSEHSLFTSKPSTNLVVAKYEYKRRNENELSFSQGDQIQVIQKNKKKGWWYGICKNQTGYFPCNYVETIQME
ncbi:beta-Pak interactive eXchange factor Src-like 3 domain protein (macronuclear) [Tetrahymena thermophila SB210]|uniref:Beta-Pak interactive eXchange factor Src-like 3 domain protein n=1 Tax=Tetrahymena thermophila (strain SB210) TaxID=312017 RepID=I7MJK5_TETTS|nr:beta-Pak interactive eXchange factor Src-like 3 domain protein [Tetrahymena thermophila SB210]EAS06698.2 beta-Pak interactive eXchange factor Src-like 3 domain protein [Tetrahymena thermophila SB210]|eukprot:XP_001026940.2 beta-Pak interactive eXchange factor Src-like 3 domain protein [Tetrahymena thermophila SB210]